MRSDLTKRLFRGVLAKGFGQGGQIVILLAEVPLFLYFWGAEFYGEWLILIALPTYLTMSDFGLAGATNRHMAMLVAKDERGEALSAFQSSSLLILALTALVATLFVLLMGLLPVIDLFHLSHFDRPDMMAVVVLLSLQIVVSNQTLLVFGGYYCVQRYPLGFLFMSLISFGRFAMLAAAVALGAAPVTVALVMVCAEAVGLIGMRIGLYRVAPWLHYGSAHISRGVIKLLAKPAIAGMAFPLGDAMTHQGSRLVIGAVFGPAAVVMFVTHRQLARLVTLVVSLAHPFRAELSNLYGMGDKEGFRSLARKTFQILIWGILAAVALDLIFAELIFVKWTAGRIEFGWVLFGLLLAASVNEAVWQAAFTPIIAINRHIEVAKFYAVISFALVPALYLASRMIGLSGLAEVLIVAEFLMIWFVLRNALALTNDRFGPWLASVARFPSVNFKL